MRTDGGLNAEVEQTAAKFAARHIKPVAADVDHAEPRFPADTFALGAEAGFDRFALPEELGGHGFQLAELCALTGTLARTCAGHAMVFGVHAATLKTIAEALGDNADRLAKRILDSNRALAVAMPEPLSHEGIDIGLTVADACGNGMFVSGAVPIAFNVSTTGFFVVFAVDAEGWPVALLAEPDGEAFIPGTPEQSLGLRAMPMAELKFKNYNAPEESVIAAGERAIVFYKELMRNLCAVTAAAAFGLMSDACARAYEYAAGRRQGGRMIIDHSHMRSMLGGMSAGVTSAAGSVALAASGAGGPATAIAVKKTVTDSAVKVCTEAVQVLGGYGYMRDYGLEKMMRDAAVLSLLPVSNDRCELLLSTFENERINK